MNLTGLVPGPVLPGSFEEGEDSLGLVRDNLSFCFNYGAPS